MEIIICDPGDEVICDFCNDSYTESEETGGCSVGSYAICPQCAKKLTEEPDQRCREK